jgi:hypothetical protein
MMKKTSLIKLNRVLGQGACTVSHAKSCGVTQARVMPERVP